jgi:hypothetical protein
MPRLPIVFGSWDDDDDDRLPRSLRQQLARVEEQGVVGMRRIQNVTLLARLGMIEVAGLSRLEVDLAFSCPTASGRLASIGDTAAAAVSVELVKAVTS